MYKNGSNEFYKIHVKIGPGILYDSVFNTFLRSMPFPRVDIKTKIQNNVFISFKLQYLNYLILLYSEYIRTIFERVFWVKRYALKVILKNVYK